MNHIVVAGKSIAPSKIVCIGRNYVDHIKELNNEMPEQTVVFIKPNSALSDDLNAYHEEPLHYEGEICFVVENNQLAYVGFGLDLTKRELQSKLKAKGLPWERAKAFNGSAVFSHFVPVPENFDNLSLRLEINQQVAQQGGVELMMVKPQEIVEELSMFLTLEDGDVIMTGTPKGVGQISSGDTFVGQIYSGSELLTSIRWQAK